MTSTGQSTSTGTCKPIYRPTVVFVKDQVEEYIAQNQRGYTHMHTKENLLLEDQQNMWSGTSQSKTCLVHVRLVNGSDGALLLFTEDPSIRSLSRSFFPSSPPFFLSFLLVLMGFLVK